MKAIYELVQSYMLLQNQIEFLDYTGIMLRKGTKCAQNPHMITYPADMKWRPPPWIYCGWTAKEEDYEKHVKEFVSGATESCVREVDEYKDFVAEWYRER